LGGHSEPFFCFFQALSLFTRLLRVPTIPEISSTLLAEMSRCLLLLVATARVTTAIPITVTGGLAIAKHRRRYDAPSSEKVQYGKGSEFSFKRFQSLPSVKAAFDSCRSPKAFKSYRGKDGRIGSVCTTRLGGDWVLAESEQLARSCTCEHVLRAYLDGRLQKRWSADKVIDVRTTRQRSSGGGEPCYVQDLVLHSQRIITSHTGVMRYSQRVRIDKIGRGNYCAFVELDRHAASTTVKKPFNSLAVYVGLVQQGEDVKIYAAGVFEVNRQVVPNLVVFDASGIAGDMAGKGTLWLSAHFAQLAAQRAQAQAWPMGRRSARRLLQVGGGVMQEMRRRLAICRRQDGDVVDGEAAPERCR
jgi:hypothetical protein